MRRKLSGIGGMQACFPPILRRALAAVIALALVGCGDLSLVGSLHQESPGELRFSPADPVIPLDTPFTFAVMGGIPPYSVVTGSVTPLDDHTWSFPAQTSPGDFPIQVSDWAGKTVETLVTVYDGGEPTLNVSQVTLPEGIGWTFTVTGGLGPYDWSVEGAYKATGPSYPFLPAPQGTYVVDVTDFLGVSQAAIVTVVPVTIGIDPLSITPPSAVVMPGGLVAFTALGGDGNYAFTAPDGGSIDNANPASYTAPGTGTYAIELTDGIGPPVGAQVIVTATGELLVLSPGSPSVSVVGDEVQFSARGGSPPYSYSTNKPANGSIDPVTGLYRQLAEGNVVVTVKDSVGLTDNTLVKWKP